MTPQETARDIKTWATVFRIKREALAAVKAERPPARPRVVAVFPSRAIHFTKYLIRHRRVV